MALGEPAADWSLQKVTHGGAGDHACSHRGRMSARDWQLVMYFAERRTFSGKDTEILVPLSVTRTAPLALATVAWR